jgi:hypothetical protein
MKIIIVNAIVAIYFAMALGGCGEPLGPGENKWQRVATINETPRHRFTVDDIATNGSDVYFVVIDSGNGQRLAVLRLSAGRVFYDWIYPDAGGGRMRSIERGGEVLWASGTATVGEPIKYVPVLIRNDGSGWKAVDLGANPGFWGVGRIYPISDNACWLLTAETKPGVWYGSLTLYDNGTLRKFPQFPYVTAAYDPAANTLYVIPYRERGGVEVAISADRGRTWVYEKARLESFPGADPTGGSILPPAVYGGDLFFVVRWEQGWPVGTAIYRRTGPPGRGVYSLAFFSNLGPYFRTVSHLAADSTPRLMGVCVDTCLVFDGAEWLLEELPYPHTSFHALTAAERGFYASAYNEITGKLELLFHP